MKAQLDRLHALRAVTKKQIWDKEISQTVRENIDELVAVFIGAYGEQFDTEKYEKVMKRFRAHYDSWPSGFDISYNTIVMGVIHDYLKKSKEGKNILKLETCNLALDMLSVIQNIPKLSMLLELLKKISPTGFGVHEDAAERAFSKIFKKYGYEPK